VLGGNRIQLPVEKTQPFSYGRLHVDHEGG
jgi:hypothetical protein